MKYISYTKCNLKNIIFITFLLASFIILLYIPFDKNFITDIHNNLSIKDFLLIIFFTFLLIFNRLIQTYTFKITPNIGYSHLIINTNIIITLIGSYFLFNQKINYKSIFGILITLIGLFITIYYSQ
jgi:drug/metabolite transporter (DMT)-like permease